MAPDTIFSNARVYTGDAAQPWAEAFAVADGRIVAVGDAAAAGTWTAEGTASVDLGGRFVMPGFVDAHNHFWLQGRTEAYECPIDPTLDLDGVLAAIRAAVADLPAGTWAVISPYSAAVAMEIEHADVLRRLDEATGNHPVMVREYSRHNRWANSAALAAAGIGPDTPQPADGVIVTDPVTGGLTGVLYEGAGLPVEHAFLDWAGYTPDDYLAMVAEGMRILNSYGITACLDAGASWEMMVGAKRLDETGGMTAWAVSGMPFYEQIFGYRLTGPGLFAKGAECRSRHHRPDFIKVFLDGIPPARTAAFSRPYLPAPGAADEDFCGETLFTTDALAELLSDGARDGLSAVVHCTGDGSVHTALDAIERVRAAGFTEPSYHISHCQFIQPADIARFAELDVVAEISPYYWVPGPVPTAIASVVPAEISDHIHPNRDLADAGVKIVVGSDWPCSDTPDAWYAIHGLVTRTDPLGLAPGALTPEQALTLEEAIAACTSEAADSLGLGTETGSLAAGKSADFIVLDRDPFEIEPTELSHVTVTETWFEGRRVFERA
ncbi:amidohydrolase [Propionicicella superfundia]|uniref:amidohydrolase n=1 Tax=Propionicicella superfundia TaxID=348582 RepID=UPI00040BF4CA|nr:amidohydrolase [Propionicicella superfundia]